MNKKRFNLRMVAAMVACLAVTTVFATCGKGGDGGENNGNGSNNSALVGTWAELVLYHTTNPLTGQVVWNRATAAYKFNKDGTFEYNFHSTPWGYKFTGKYTVSNSKIYFKEMKGFWFSVTETEPMETSERDHWEVIMNYELGTDSGGKYITTYILHVDKDHTPRADWSVEYKFRIQ